MGIETEMIKIHELTLTIRITETEDDFAKPEKLRETYLAFLSRLLWLVDSRFQFMWCVKVKSIPQQRKKTHADVQLPRLSRNGVAKRKYAVK